MLGDGLGGYGSGFSSHLMVPPALRLVAFEWARATPRMRAWTDPWATSVTAVLSLHRSLSQRRLVTWPNSWRWDLLYPSGFHEEVEEGGIKRPALKIQAQHLVQLHPLRIPSSAINRRNHC